MAQQPSKAEASAELDIVPGGIPAPPAPGSILDKLAQIRGAMAHELAVEVTGKATVTVACKHPAGFRLQMYRFVEEQQPVMGGGTRTVKVSRPTGEDIYIKGNAHPQGQGPRAEIVGGYALTHGVPKDFWDAWIALNKDWGPVKAGLLFAHETPGYVRDGAKANRERISGLERLDPAKSLPPGVERVPTAARAA